MGPGALSEMLGTFEGMFRPEEHPELLVGLDSADDAAVYKISDDTAVIFTVDFLTPVVDDPFTYGAIAAANSMSDVYAMGGRVVLALNVASFPDDLPVEIPGAILRGGAEKIAEAGAVLAGGLHLLSPERYPDSLFMLFSGGLMIGAIYMATDMVTSPVTNKGCWIFGAGIGALVVIIRLWGGLNEGVMYAILLMNGMVPFLNRWTQPKVFGTATEKAQAREAT